ncbi:L-seryl-tRNA(Sec) selenium transferase [bacterium]|nr:L-seryl-tRNA(Sec) selenium transferase [bacterium]
MNNKIQSEKHTLFSKIPAVEKLLQLETVRKLCEEYPENYVHSLARRVVEDVRTAISSGSITSVDTIPSMDDLAQWIEDHIKTEMSPKLMRAINGAGVILHTGLGRAPLAKSAQDALRETAARYAILATDRESGKRGDRNRHVVEMLKELTGAEDALVVNNNSAAVMLALNTFGDGREAIVSRGELVEIGGAFRVPDVMARSGSIMVEVGTTNKTHLRDYENAITDQTAYILKVHTSNYRIEGFHQDVSIRDLKTLTEKHGLIILHDIGSGAMVDLRKWGLTYEPTVPEAIADGADVVTFSGDKLLGGPQCGVIVGRKDLIDKMKRNPLMRAFRVDKLILSALNGTLKLFLDPDKLPETHPVYAMMNAPMDNVKRRAQRIKRMIRDVAGEFLEVELETSYSEMGSGALPARPIPTYVVTLIAHKLSPTRLASSLRMSNPPLFTRIEDEKVIIDARTIADDEVRLLKDVFQQCTNVRFAPEHWIKWDLSVDPDSTKSGSDELPAIG